MASAFNICALAPRWRVTLGPGATEDTATSVEDPPWLIGINTLSLALALAANIALNRDSLTEGQMSCGALDWSEPARLDFHSSEADGPSRKNPFEGATAAHLVLAADTIYSEEHPPLLAATVLRWLSRADPTARFVMCLPLRACYLDELRDLWSLLEAGGLECIQDGQEMADQRTFDDECLCEWSIWRWKPEFRKEG